MIPVNALLPSRGGSRGAGGGAPVSSSVRRRLGGRGGVAGSSWLAGATDGSRIGRRPAASRVSVSQPSSTARSRGVSGVITSVRDFVSAG
jgi:hypothetical protein